MAMAYEEGTDGRCSPLMEIHSLSWLLHKREAPLAYADPSDSIPTMRAVDIYAKYRNFLSTQQFNHNHL